MRLEAKNILDRLEFLEDEEKRKKEIEPRINLFIDIYDKENLKSMVDIRAKELSDIIKDSYERIPRLYSYLDDIFKNFMPSEGAGHSKLMFAAAAGVGSKLDFSSAELKELGYGAVMHDLGKLVLPGKLMDIIEKGDYFSVELHDLMNTHIFTGYLIVEQATRYVDDLNGCAMKPLCHQEELDGNGPLGLTKNEIFLINKIIRVVDSYFAISSRRSYDDVTPHDESIEELKRCAYYEKSELDMDVLEWSNRNKLDQIRKKYFKNNDKDSAGSIYNERLVEMIKRNTRRGIRVPDGMDYNNLIKSDDNEELEEAYIKIRLTPEKQFSRLVVEKFIEFVTANPKAIQNMLESSIIYPT